MGSTVAIATGAAFMASNSYCAGGGVTEGQAQVLCAAFLIVLYVVAVCVCRYTGDSWLTSLKLCTGVLLAAAAFVSAVFGLVYGLAHVMGVPLY